jgi:hypothetical protein
MRLSRADWQLVDAAREAIGRFPATKPVWMVEAGCRSAEVSCTLMRQFPHLLAGLCGGWPRTALAPDVTWYEQQEWDRRYDMALDRTRFEPARRVSYRHDPWECIGFFAPYQLAVVAFTDTDSIGNLAQWYSRVQSNGLLCGVRGESTDAFLRRWLEFTGITARSTWRSHSWSIHRHP